MTESRELAELVAHAERQTKALENMNTALMRTLAVLALVLVVAVIAGLTAIQ